MSEDEFIEGLDRYYNTEFESIEARTLWTNFIVKAENDDLYRLCITLGSNRPTIEQVKELWLVRNSPLSKAMA